MASARAFTGSWPLSRRSFVGLIPRPTQGLGGNDAMPGAQTVVAGLIPTAYSIPIAVMPSRKAVSSP